MGFLFFILIGFLVIAPLANGILRLIFGIGWFTCQVLKFIIPIFLILLVIAAVTQ